MERRLAEHNRKRKKFTDRGIPWKIIYNEKYQTKEQAQTREKCINLTMLNPN